jgi:hypothetical protein
MKVNKNFTLDEEIIPLISKDAEEQTRSESFIVNEILKKHYEKEGKK